MEIVKSTPKHMKASTHPFARKRVTVMVIFAIGIVVASVLSLMIGQVSFQLGDIWQALVSKDDSVARRIVWDLRFPRVLIGLIIGMCLASSGAILQGVMRNPLADPGIIGVTAGAGLSATFIMIVFPAYIGLVPLAAFLGALVTAIAIYLLSWRGGTSPVRIILVGVAVNAVLGACMSALMIFYSERVQSVLPWLAGGIQGVGWNQFQMIIYYAIAALILAIYGIRHIRILRLGDEMAQLLGHNVERSRLYLIAVSTLLAGIAVSVAGLVGFVGLVVPHILRIILGGDYRYLLPASALGGGLLVILADTVARSAFNPIEIPVGILLAFLGGPFFLYLIQRKGNSFAAH